MHPDDLLERALASYTTGEPSPTFTKRVSARINSRRRWFWAAVPVAAAAACVVGVVSFRKPMTPVVRQHAAMTQVTRHAIEDAPMVAVQPHTLRVRFKSKQLRNPNRQERALMLWLSESPETALAEWETMKRDLDAPLVIKQIELEPIAVKEMTR